MAKPTVVGRARLLAARCTVLVICVALAASGASAASLAPATIRQSAPHLATQRTSPHSLLRDGRRAASAKGTMHTLRSPSTTALPPVPPLCSQDVVLESGALGTRDGGCLVDTGDNNDVSVRGDSQFSITAPKLITVGVPFRITAHPDVAICTDGGARPCVTNWSFGLRNVNTVSSFPLTLVPVSTDPSQACQGDFFGVADSSHEFDNDSLSCTAVVKDSDPAVPIAGIWFSIWGEADYVDSHDWSSELDSATEVQLPPGPVAAFEVSDFSGTDPGQFQFTSTSTAPPGEVLSYAWDYGDDTSGSGPGPSHTYTAPGQFKVTLTITDSSGETASVSHEVEVKAPKLAIGIGFPGSGGNVPNPDPGSTLPISITMSAGNGVGELTGLHFTGEPLTFSPAILATVKGSPSPPFPPLTFTLKPGDSATYTFMVHANSLGVVDITTMFSGSDAANNLVQASDDEVMQIGKALKVTVSAAPKSTIQLDDDDSGNEIPQAFGVVVAVTNPYNIEITHVTVDDTPILESLDAAEEKNPVVLKQDASKPTPSLDLGSLGPGQTNKVTFPFLALKDGQERVSWGARAVDPSTGVGVAGVGHLNVHINPDYLVTLQLKGVDGGGGIVNAGDNYGIDVDLVNISNSASVAIDQMTPTLSGNAGGGNPFDVDDPPGPVLIAVPSGAAEAAPLGPCDTPAEGAPASANQAVYYLPWSGSLGAGDPMNLATNIYTVPGGGTRASTSYTVTGTATLDDGTTQKLDDGNVLVLNDSGDADSDAGNTAMLSTTVDDSSTSSTAPSSPSTVAWNFTAAAAIGAAQWWCSTFAAVGALGKSLISHVGPWGANKDALAAYQAIEYGLTWYQNLTPDEKDDWLDWAYEDIKKQANKKATITFDALNAQVTAWWAKGISAWNSGNDNALALWAGQASGYGSLEVSSWFVGTVWSRSVISLEERAKVAQLATQAAEGGSKLATKVPVGVNLLAKYPKLIQLVYGLTEDQAQALSELAKAENALIAVRSRNPFSIEAEKLWGAWNKPASVKIKSVDDVDIKLLGYPPTVTVNGISGTSESLAILRDPAESAAYLKAHSAGVKPVLLQAAESRLALRTKEWGKYQKEYEEFTKTGAPVEMNYSANGLGTTEPAPGYNLRKFALQGDGTGNSILLIDNGAGKLVPITGDVDVVAITTTRGTLLSPESRLKVYQSLQSADGIGMQHGETLSWLTGDDAQTKLLTDHVGPNAERLLVFDPEGAARTATIDAAHTTFTSSDMSLNGVWFVGAYKTPLVTAFQNVVLALKQLDTTVVPWIGPTSWYLTGKGLVDGPPPNGNNNNQLGGCGWQFSTGSGSSTLEPDGNGGLNQYVNGKWVPYQPPAGCVPSGSSGSSSGGSNSQFRFSSATSAASHGPRATTPAVIEIDPQSALFNNVSAGSSSLSLIPLSLVDPAARADSTPWFAVGDTIVIDPGGADAESATITSLSPLRLSAPLHFAHPAGEMVSVTAAPAG